MHVKFTNSKPALQNIFKDGQMLASLKPGESYTTGDSDLIEKLQLQTDMDAEEVEAPAASEESAAAAAKPKQNRNSK